MAGGGDGDDWVQKHEFKKLLVNIFWFNYLWTIFEDINGDDRRIDIKEFRKVVPFNIPLDFHPDIF